MKNTQTSTATILNFFSLFVLFKYIMKYLTEKKLKELKEELRELKMVERPKIMEKVRIAISFGDLSENAEYQNAKEEQGFLEGKIAELEEIIKQAKIIKKKENLGYVRIGSLVTIENIDNKKIEEFEIVGAGESDPLKRKISYESPLGNALFKNKEKDIIEVLTPNKKIKYKIIKIR